MLITNRRLRSRFLLDVDDRESRVVHRATPLSLQCILYISCDPMKLLCAYDKIDMRQIFQQRRSPRLRHAAEKTKNNMRTLVGNAPEHPHFAKRLLIGHIADAAGVQ